jgi:hypothetical protein
MKVLIIFILMVYISGQALAQTNTVSSTSSTVSGTTTVDRTPSTASAPSVVVNQMDSCVKGTSVAIQTQVLGLAGGTTVKDLNCERLKLSKALYQMGMKPCPIQGKIGAEAQKIWDENPHLIPDYEKFVKENKENDIIPTKEESIGLGIGLSSILWLLLL